MIPVNGINEPQRLDLFVLLVVSLSVFCFSPLIVNHWTVEGLRQMSRDKAQTPHRRGGGLCDPESAALPLDQTPSCICPFPSTPVCLSVSSSPLSLLTCLCAWLVVSFCFHLSCLSLSVHTCLPFLSLPLLFSSAVCRAWVSFSPQPLCCVCLSVPARPETDGVRSHLQGAGDGPSPL